MTPGSTLSPLFKIRIVFGFSAVAGLAILQTRRSPSDVCDVSMSDFCFEDEACQARLTIGDGERDVFSVCKTVKEGCRLAMMMEPFLYLREKDLLAYWGQIVVDRYKAQSYPIAYVKQSAAGAIAVIGSNIVLAE